MALPVRPLPLDANVAGFSDYSALDIGAVSMLEEQDGQLILSRFISRALRGAETSYSSIEGEALA